MLLEKVLGCLVVALAFLFCGAVSGDADGTKDGEPYWTIHIETDAESCEEIGYEPAGSEVEFTELVNAEVMISDEGPFPPEGYAFYSLSGVEQVFEWWNEAVETFDFDSYDLLIFYMYKKSAVHYQNMKVCGVWEEGNLRTAVALYQYRDDYEPEPTTTVETWAYSTPASDKNYEFKLYENIHYFWEDDDDDSDDDTDDDVDDDTDDDDSNFEGACGCGIF